jgi:hypothetical protein
MDNINEAFRGFDAEAMRHELHVFGVPTDGPTNIFCDDPNQHCPRSITALLVTIAAVKMLRPVRSECQNSMH